MSDSLPFQTSAFHLFAATAAVGGVVGVFTGLVIGPALPLVVVDLFLGAISLPPLVASVGGSSRQLAIGVGVWTGISAGCVLSLYHTGLPVFGSIWITVLFCSVLAAQGGTVLLLLACRVPPLAAAAAVTCVGVLWLTWPLWLTSASPPLTWIHPVMALNSAVVATLGVWTEQPIAYRIMALGQDVPYALSHTPVASALAHGTWALLSMLAATWVRRLWSGDPTKIGNRI